MPKRDDPNFKALRFTTGEDPDQWLEDKKNQVIPLPDLLDYPKDFNPNEVLSSTLLTPERIEILRNFARKVHLGETYRKNDLPEMGIILSGPNGVGKSIMSYLLACTAFINGCILVYCPKPAQWTLGNEAAYHSYFIDRLIRYNATILSSFPVRDQLGKPSSSQTLLDMAVQPPSETVYLQLTNQLKGATKVPVVYILDEHNELYKDGFQERQKTTFANWTKSSGTILDGLRILPILSGSAHSKFELEGILQTAMDDWKVHLRPMSWESTQVLMTEGQPLKLPADSNVQPREFYDLNGGTPREMRKCLKFLNNPNYPKQQRTLAKWRADRKTFLWNAAIETKKKLDPDRLKVYRTFITNFFLVRRSTDNPPGMFFDSGLIYLCSEGIHRPICQAACDALLTLFRDDTTITLDDVLRDADPKQQGLHLESWVATSVLD